MSVTTLHRRMLPRDTTEENRAATPLELFFDLCFVVAVAQAGLSLHHDLAEGHIGDALIGYAMSFFAIWWAWMNFTWFASAYDSDDLPYRLAVFVQITGALIIAAGIPRAFDHQDASVVTVGYVVMRMGLVSQWLRAAHSDLPGRRTALRFAVGVSACQLGWIARLALPEGATAASFALMAAAELAVPIWAERAGSTAWHPRHIAERYGLFTIIVLGETVLAAVVAIQAALDDDGELGELLPLIVGGLLIVFCMWSFYFAKPAERLLTTTNRFAFLWGYGHLFVFASGAAVGAGIAVGVDHAVGHAHISNQAAGVAVTIPVAIYLLVVWALHLRPHHADPVGVVAVPLTALLVLAATFTGEPVLATGVLLASLLALSYVLAAASPPARWRRHHAGGHGK